jgi:ribosomal protein L37E
MTLTQRIKRAAGLADGEVGVESDRERTIRECTVCGERFNPAKRTCTACGSQLSRTKTVVPHALLNLLVVLGATGLHAMKNVLTGNVPPE